MGQEQPDAVMLYGDTNSCLAVIAAKRRKIPVFHMEAGNRCFDQRVPEELNRKVLDHLSDINLVLTEHARRYLIAEGIRPENHHQNRLAYAGGFGQLHAEDPKLRCRKPNGVADRPFFSGQHSSRRECRYAGQSARSDADA